MNQHLTSKKTVFLDKDGTLIENIPYNINPDKIKLCEGAKEGLQLLQSHHYKLIVITNQAGVAKGYFPESAIIPVEQRLRELLAEFDVYLDDFYYCPHHPEGIIPTYTIDCNCRKPRSGLIEQAAVEHSIDLNQSWFIGDILHDIEAGRNAGCRTILIDNGNETEWRLSPANLPHHLAQNLTQSARIIVETQQGAPLVNLQSTSFQIYDSIPSRFN